MATSAAVFRRRNSPICPHTRCAIYIRSDPFVRRREASGDRAKSYVAPITKPIVTGGIARSGFRPRRPDRAVSRRTSCPLNGRRRVGAEKGSPAVRSRRGSKARIRHRRLVRAHSSSSSSDRFLRANRRRYFVDVGPAYGAFVHCRVTRPPRSLRRPSAPQ